MATSRVFGIAALAVLAGVLPVAGQQVSAPANRDRRVITTEEIEQAHSTDAYQVIEKLRPEFLRRMSRPQTLGGGGVTGGRGGGTNRNPGGGGGATGGGTGSTGGGTDGETMQPDPGFSQPDPPRTAAVFVDGTEMGGVEELQRLQANLVEEIRYLSGSDAQTKYGARFSAGVIEVKLKNH
jgi:hypothetical protein